METERQLLCRVRNIAGMLPEVRAFDPRLAEVAELQLHRAVLRGIALGAVSDVRAFAVEALEPWESAA